MAKKELPKLLVEKRTIKGRKIKRLRRQGILPANIYGKKIKSLAVQVESKVFLLVYKETGETGIVELKIKGEEKTKPVLIHNVQFHPVSDLPLHVDFHQVDLEEKVSAKIPVEIVGESPVVAQKSGVLFQPLSGVEVEALPADLPDKFEIEAVLLDKIEAAITVGDLKPPAGVKILTPPGEILVKIEPPAKEEVVVPPVEEATPTGEEKPTEEKAEEAESAEKPAETL